METKLTLRMDTKLIDAAKRFAQKQGVSLSKLVADYFKMIASKKNRNVEGLPLTPILSEITGVLHKNVSDTEAREAYHKYLEERYL